MQNTDQTNQNKQLNLSSEGKVKEDRVASDFKMFGSTFFDIFKNLKAAFFPESTKVNMPNLEAKKGMFDKFLSSEKSSKILKGLIKLVFLAGALVFSAFVIIGIIKRSNNGGVVSPVSQITPSQAQIYQPQKKSLYAEDAEILKLEQDLGVLDSEIQNAQINDTSLKPTSLDFDINFKK